MSKRPSPDPELFKKALSATDKQLEKAQVQQFELEFAKASDFLQEQAIRRANLLEKTRRKLEKQAAAYTKASVDDQWAMVMQHWDYKDAVMSLNGLRISQMLRDPAYDSVLTSDNLQQHADYDMFEARNLAVFHRSGNEDALGWE